jgi:hypothetical protein
VASFLWIVILSAILAGTLSCVPGDGEAVHEANRIGPPEDLFATEAPPPLRAEVIVDAPPGPEHVWVGGYWTRLENSWTWVRGRWCLRPHPTAVWVSGHWEKLPRGYAYTPGYWK